MIKKKKKKTTVTTKGSRRGKKASIKKKYPQKKKAIAAARKDLSDDRGLPKLERKHQLFVCSCLATGYGPQVTVDLLYDTYGIELSRSTVVHTYMREPYWKKKIRRMERYMEKQMVKHPLMNKINRLNYILAGIREALTWRDDKINYNKWGQELSRIKKRNLAALANFLKLAQIEAEAGVKTTDPAWEDEIEIMSEKQEKYIKNRMTKYMQN